MELHVIGGDESGLVGRLAHPIGLSIDLPRTKALFAAPSQLNVVWCVFRFSVRPAFATRNPYMDFIPLEWKIGVAKDVGNDKG